MFTREDDERLLKLLEYIPNITEPTDAPFKNHQLPASIKSRLFQILIQDYPQWKKSRIETERRIGTLNREKFCVSPMEGSSTSPQRVSFMNRIKRSANDRKLLAIESPSHSPTKLPNCGDVGQTQKPKSSKKLVIPEQSIFDKNTVAFSTRRGLLSQANYESTPQNPDVDRVKKRLFPQITSPTMPNAALNVSDPFLSSASPTGGVKTRTSKRKISNKREHQEPTPEAVSQYLQFVDGKSSQDHAEAVVPDLTDSAKFALTKNPQKRGTPKRQKFRYSSDNITLRRSPRLRARS